MLQSPASQRRTIVASLVAKIARDIEAGQLLPGERLAAQKLADRFEVSRSPINDALNRLAERGLVVHRSNKGYQVADQVIVSPQGSLGSESNLVEESYWRIADDRLDGQLAETITQSELRRRYGLTTTQLGELVTRMETEGWLRRRPGYGLKFVPILTTPETLLQTYRVRVALEPASLVEPGYTLDRIRAAECRRVEEAMLDGAIETMSTIDLYDRGVRFHECIVGASMNPFYLDALRRINSVRRLLAYRSMADRARYYDQALDHLHILTLLEEGRNEEASSALRTHLGKVIQNLDPIRQMLTPRARVAAR